jgi:acyl carrier protein
VWTKHQEISLPRRLSVSIEEQVINVVAEQLAVDKVKITRETSFVNDLGADSLDTVELIMELEEEFDLMIPESAAEQIQTVGQAIDFIETNNS